mgnify:FL=1
MYGGNEKTHYYLNFGMNYANSLLKYGESKKAYDMSFNVRGNVDMALASWLKATTNAAIIFDNSYQAVVTFGERLLHCAPTGLHHYYPLI